MSVSLDHDLLQETQERLAIPRGGLLLALGVVPLTGITAVGIAMSTGDRAYPYGPLFAVALVIVQMLAIMMIYANPLPWLKRYWRCNVIGYAIWVHPCNDGKLQIWRADRAKQHRWIWNRFSCRYLPETCSTCTRESFLVIPLGGWWHRACVLHGCSLRWKAQICWFDHRALERSTVRLRDSNGDRLTVPVPEVFQLTDRGDLDHAIIRLLRECRERGDRLATAQTVIGITIKRIRDTTRFGKSTEGKAIREWLETQLPLIGITSGPPRSEAPEVATTF